MLLYMFITMLIHLGMVKKEYKWYYILTAFVEVPMAIGASINKYLNETEKG